jgi:monovalent cation:H+ antiporter, CPA1 family
MLAFTRAFRVAHWIYRRFGFSAPLARAIADRYELLLVVQLVLRELDRAIRGSIRNLLGQETSAALAPLLEVRRVAVRDALAAIGLQYPAYAEALRSQYLQRSALRIEEADYERWREESLISPEVHEDLARAIDARREALDRRPPLDLGLRLSEMMRRVPALSELPAERVNDIVRMLRPRLAVPGEAIIRKGERGDAMYFVASGEVEVHLPHAPVRLATGEFFGEMALLEARPRNADVHAVGFCHLLALGASDFLRALRGHPDLWERIRTTAEARRAATPSS